MKKNSALFHLLLLLFTFLALPCSARDVKVSYYTYGRIHEQSADGKRSGFGYEVLELLAKKGGWTNDYVGYGRSWSDAEKMIASGEIEILDCVRKLPEREARYEFSAQPAGFSFALILVRKDEKRFTPGEYLAWGKVKVGVMANESVGIEFRDYAAIHGIANEIKVFPTSEAALEALKTGAVDMALVESMADTAGFHVLESFNPKPYYFCTKKGNRALMDEIDRAMAKAYDDDPSWYVNITRKYYPREDVTVYLPRIHNYDDVHNRYLRAMSDLLASIGGWTPSFKECAADFSDADLSVPCIVAHVHRTPENLKKFDFPFVTVCRRPVCLFANPADKRFEHGIPKGAGAFRVGYDRKETDWLKCFLEYARDNNFAYKLVPFDSTDDLRAAVQTKSVDLAIFGLDSRRDLNRVVKCGFVEFDFVTPKSQPALRRTLDMSVRYMRYHEGDFIRRLEHYAYGIEDSSRVVRAGVYVETGAIDIAEDGSVNGYVAEYLREIARVSGWDLVFVPMTYSEALDGLAAGEIDIVGVSSPTPVRSDRFDVSGRDAGVVRYALKVKKDSKLLPNRPDLWIGNRIGYLAGSTAVNELRTYLDMIGAKYELVPYDSMRVALADVKAGRLEGFYTVHARETEDYRTVAVFPLVHTLFCTNKHRPSIKRDVDAAMNIFAAQNMDFNWWLNNHYLKTSREQLTFDANEIDFVNRYRGHKFVIGFPRTIVPVADYDEKTGRASGFLVKLFTLIDEKCDLDFTFTGNGKADVYVVDRDVVKLDDDLVVFNDWFPLPTVRISLPEDEIPASVRGIWAVESRRHEEIEYIRRNNWKPLLFNSREECYRAVVKGKAEATIDNLGSARLMIDENREFRGLRDSRIDSKEWARQVTIAFPSDGDPELRRIFKKARTSITDTTSEKLFLDAIIESRKGRITFEDLLYYGAFVSVGILFVILLIVVYNEQRVRREQIAKAASEAASKSKTAFLFNMSHDIRTPMNAIMGFTGIALKNLSDPDKVKDCITKTRQAGGLLLSIINSILDMSRIEAGKAKLNEIEGDARMSFVNIEGTMQELARSNNVTLTFEFGEIRNPYVYCDFERSVRIFVNLISNAIKYTPAGGWVKVRCEQVLGSEKVKVKGEKVWYRYTFEDNGIGMGEEFQKHLFEEFSREQNSTTSGIQGTGLGLALTKSFVDLMGGTIKCESKQGSGTKFIVELPFRVNTKAEYTDPKTGEKVKSNGEKGKSADVKDEKSTLLHLSPSTFTSKRVLLVEDNALNREVAEYLLRELGFEVETAENGAEAVEKVCKLKSKVEVEENDHHSSTSTPNFNYDFVLMDIQMPVMDGYEATRQIREWEKEKLRVKSEEVRVMDGKNSSTLHSSLLPLHLPIIALSANAFAEDRAASLAAGMDDHVAKPIKVNELMRALAKFA